MKMTISEFKSMVDMGYAIKEKSGERWALNLVNGGKTVLEPVEIIKEM